MHVTYILELMLSVWAISVNNRTLALKFWHIYSREEVMSIENNQYFIKFYRNYFSDPFLKQCLYEASGYMLNMLVCYKEYTLDIQ